MSQFNNSSGIQLQSLLKEIYPFNSKDTASFTARIDQAFMEDGKFSEIVYESSINYMVRRLIKTAKYIKNKNSEIEDKYIQEIRKHLNNYTRIPKNFIERILLVLIDCLKAMDQNPSQRDAKSLLKQAEDEGLRCYICGQELGFSESGKYNFAEVEHIFPKSLGGSSDVSNLKIVCHRCNQIKKSYINSDDFHYEFIALAQEKTDRNYDNEFPWEYRVPLYIRSECKCVVCGKEAKTEGRLNLGRIQLTDSWHFLNIQAYCDKHTPE